MTKMNISSLLTYPVFRLGDSPFTRKLHRVHMYIVGFFKVSSILFPALIAMYLLFGFYLPSKISFSTHTQNCALAPTVLPRLLSAAPTEHYNVVTPAKISINGYPVLATQMCVEPTAIPSSGTSTLSVRQLKLPIGKKLTIENRSSLSASALVKDDLVSTKSNMIFELSKADLFFDYMLVVGNKSVECVVQESTVACPTNELGLQQGEPYTFVLKQTLGGTSQQLFAESLTTITSAELVSSSISEAQVVYDTPLSAQLTFSKPLIRATGVKLLQGDLEVPASHTTDGVVVSITWENQLERQKPFTIQVDSVLAEDGGYLEQPALVHFTTSGGPKVVNTTLPSAKATISPDFTLTFDHSIKPEQDFSSLVSLTSSGQPIPISITPSGTTLRIRTKQQLPTCTDFSITIKDTLISAYGISGGSAYTMASRTQCSRQFSIGKSVQGRDITAYSIGNGPEKVLYIGAIHGNEKSAYYLLSSWLDYLESNPSAIPGNKTVVIIPKLNPDAFVSGSRFNANNVDLNRNFASASWKTDVKVPGGSILAGGGGSAPLSEPESQAIITYINSVGPSLVMSYHSQGSIVIANGSGNSNSFASMYANLVGYDHVATEGSEEAFEHETTGALEDWLHESPDIPVVLLELSSHTTNNIFQYHKTPMLNVLK